MGIGRKVMWGLAGAATTKATRAMTRRAMHNRYGSPRLPRPVQRKNGMGAALMLAAGAGLVLALSDVFKEQRKIVRERADGTA